MKLKQITALLLTFAAVPAFAGCAAAGGEDAQNTTAETTAEEQITEASEAQTTESVAQEVTTSSETAEETTQSSEEKGTDSDTLVVYFSRTGEQYTVGEIDKGNTAIVAEMIAEATGADTFEILPEDDYYPYTYDALTDVAKQEQNENARPAYKGEAPDMAKYSTVYVGSPVWWGDWPMIMYTFFENEDLSGKTLIPFSTHEGSGLSGFDTKLQAAVPGANVAEGLAIRGNDAQNKQDEVRAEVESFVNP